jgi:hypothetical protein
MWNRFCTFSNVKSFYSHAHTRELTSLYNNRGGMIAPVLGGALLMASRSLPVYTSVVVFIIAVLCTLMLRIEEDKVSAKDKDGGGALAH